MRLAEVSPPREERAENKIEGIVALITALAAALRDQGGSSVYEEGGVIADLSGRPAARSASVKGAARIGTMGTAAHMPLIV